MKKTTKLMAIIFAICFAATSMGCALVSKDSGTPYAYEIYTDDDMPLFVQADGTRIEGGNYSNPSAPKEREVSIFGETYLLKYTGSDRHFFKDVDCYATEDEVLRAEYFAGTDKIWYIYLCPKQPVKDDKMDSEEEYKRFIMNFVNEFVQEDFEKYTYKCTSTCELMGGLDGSETIDGFVPKNGDRNVMSYELTFGTSIGGVETTDRIYAVVSLPFLNFPRFETNAANYTRLEIEFNPHEFDDVAEIDIKDGRVEATLSAAKQAYADKGFEGEVIYDINWVSEEDQAPQWRMLNGEPAYVCTYYAVRKSSEYEEGRGQTVMFYIRPTIESGEVRK